jgi:hypothetical protein
MVFMRCALLRMASALWRSRPVSPAFSSAQKELGLPLDRRKGIAQVVRDGPQQILALLL